MSFETKISVEVLQPGNTTVFCDKLLHTLRLCPEGEVEFELLDDDYLLIRPLSRKIDFNIRSLDPESYPELQLAPSYSYFNIPQSDFSDMISHTNICHIN